MALMEKPSLFKEIGKVAWYTAKVLGCFALVIGLLFWLFRDRPIVGTAVLCGLFVVCGIVLLGWQTYKWKKRDWERQLEQEERDRLCKEARNTGDTT